MATNSKGHIFVYHRRDTTRLFEFDRNGNFVKEIGKGYYGFEFAHSVRVDKDDNIWTVDEGTNMVTKFSPEGKVLMVLGRRPPAVDGPVVFPAGPNQPAQKYIFCRPTDVGWDPQGNIFISDGYCNNRVVKYDKDGRFLAQAGSEKAGKGLGEFNLPHGLAGGRAGQRLGRRSHQQPLSGARQQLEADSGNHQPRRRLDAVHLAGPHQYVFLSNSNPNGNAPGTWDITGEIYKAELDGTVLGKFGKPGKVAPGFQVVHMMDCRNPNEIILGEIESWRVQKFILQPPRAQRQRTNQEKHHEHHLEHSAVTARWRHRRGLRRSPRTPRPRSNFDSPPNAIELPDDLYLGEVGGVATNSRGDIFVYTRTGHPTVTIGTARPFAHGGSRLFQFDRNGQVHARDRHRALRIYVRRAGARRPAGQHLGG